MQHVDIAIIGGGIVGLTLAAALKDAPCSIAVINKHPLVVPLLDTPSPRVSAINQANIEALDSLGVWQFVQQDRVNPYKAMHVWDKDSFGDIHFNCDDMGNDSLGVIAENAALVNGLADSVMQQANVTVVTQSIERMLVGPSQSMLMLDNNDAISCRLLVGADGANSSVRKQANFPITFRDYEHTAIVANIQTEHPHNNVARQAFTPTGPLALLPMANPHVCSIVWSQTPDAASKLQQCNDDDFCHALTVASDAALGNVSLQTSRHTFPLTMRYARSWAKDALALADTLSALLNRQKDIAQHRYLRPYERARKTEAVKMIAAMDGFKFLFDGNDPVKKLIRGVGLAATDKLTTVKQAFVAHAMGL